MKMGLLSYEEEAPTVYILQGVKLPFPPFPAVYIINGKKQVITSQHR